MDTLKQKMTKEQIAEAQSLATKIYNRIEANAIKPSQVKSKKLLIAQKKIFFKINNRESPEWSASFYENGIVEHSARPKGKYKVKGLTVFVVDVEKVKLVFESEDIKKGDIFTGDSPSSNGTLYFKVLKKFQRFFKIVLPYVYWKYFYII
mgnify:CR=1 FL=1